MILKVISHLLLQKSHLKTGSTRIIFCEIRRNLTWQTNDHFCKQTIVFGKQTIAFGKQ